uniref:Retrotransposon protein n=1 Tax=Steinernema glaseri TaxID=37863 RepID=A0A1I7ZTA9_9BILA
MLPDARHHVKRDVTRPGIVTFASRHKVPSSTKNKFSTKSEVQKVDTFVTTFNATLRNWPDVATASAISAHKRQASRNFDDDIVAEIEDETQDGFALSAVMPRGVVRRLVSGAKTPAQAARFGGSKKGEKRERSQGRGAVPNASGTIPFVRRAQAPVMQMTATTIIMIVMEEEREKTVCSNGFAECWLVRHHCNVSSPSIAMGCAPLEEIIHSGTGTAAGCDETQCLPDL